MDRGPVDAQKAVGRHLKAELAIEALDMAVAAAGRDPIASFTIATAVSKRRAVWDELGRADKSEAGACGPTW
ncbi:hypothetical protein QO004_001579 [Rhizobium mesoamericanum]|nr:hypothetical protein [Rhizobium mesoamericanum]